MGGVLPRCGDLLVAPAKEAALVRATSCRAATKDKKNAGRKICWKVISSSVSAADLNFPMHRAAVG
jgi:hypothetical protein